MARQRDKEEMAADVAIALSSELSDDATCAVIRNVVWHWTLHGLTYKRDCPFVSKKVLRLTKRADWASKAARGKWTFEHAVPIKVLLELLCQCKTRSKQRKLLDRYAIACLVTKDEDKKLRQRRLRSRMPEGWTCGDDVFARYNAVGIEVVERE